MSFAALSSRLRIATAGDQSLGNADEAW